MNSITFGTNKYCGPSVISAICNITTDEAEVVIQKTLNITKPIKAMWPADIRRSFNALGYECQSVNFPKNTSLFTAMFKLQGKDGYYVFEVWGHVVAVEVKGNERFFVDSMTRIPINLCASARLGEKIVSVFKVNKCK